MSVDPTVCFFCGMPGASTSLSDLPWAIHQYGCGTVQCISHPSGEIVSSQQSPACVEIVRLQERIQELEKQYA